MGHLKQSDLFQMFNDYVLISNLRIIYTADSYNAFCESLTRKDLNEKIHFQYINLGIILMGHIGNIYLDSKNLIISLLPKVGTGYNEIG